MPGKAPLPKFKMLPAELRSQMIRLAALDIILCKGVFSRRWFFRPAEVNGWDRGTFDNRNGDTLEILLSGKRGLIKGFYHESELSPFRREPEEVWPGIYTGFPKGHAALLGHDSMEKLEVTFCLWCTSSDSKWTRGPANVPRNADDGSEYLLSEIPSTPEEYCVKQGEWLGRAINQEAVADIYAGKPVTKEIIRALYPRRNLRAVLRELSELPIRLA